MGRKNILITEDISLSFEIRKAVLEDSSCLANIIINSWKSAYANIIPEKHMIKHLDYERRKKQFERFIRENEIVLIASYKDIPCGLAFANKDNDEGLIDCASIYCIYFLEESWGKGLASILMEELINTLKDYGCKNASLWVYELNTRAIKFYEKCGFKFDGTKKNSSLSSDLVELRYIKEIIN